MKLSPHQLQLKMQLNPKREEKTKTKFIRSRIYQKPQISIGMNPVVYNWSISNQRFIITVDLQTFLFECFINCIFIKKSELKHKMQHKKLFKNKILNA